MLYAPWKWSIISYIFFKFKYNHYVSCIHWYGLPRWLPLVVKYHPTMLETQETRVWSLGWEDPQMEQMAAHSSILAWRNLETQELSRLRSMRSERVDHSWVTEQERRLFGKPSTRNFLFSPFSQHWETNLTWINYYFSWGVHGRKMMTTSRYLPGNLILDHKAFPLLPFWPSSRLW